MYINIILYVLLLIGAYGFSVNGTEKNRRKFIVFCSLVLVLKAALRSVTVGVDTSHYAGYFYESMETSWKEIFYLMQTETGINDLEAGYRFIEKIFSSILPNFNLFTFFAQLLLYYWPIGVLMKKETNTIREALFGYILLNALFSGLPMANARQVYAIGFCIWSYLFLVDKKYIVACLFVVIAYTIHHSSLLFFLLIGISFAPYKFFKYLVWVSIGLTPLVLLLVNQVILFMARFVGSDKYASYGEVVAVGGGLTYIVLSIGLCIFAAINIKKCHDSDYKKKLFYSIVIFTALIAPLIFSNGTMMRITMYFQIFFVMLMPKLLEVSFSSKNKTTVYALLILFLIILSLINSVPYKFFWEENQNPYVHWS